MTIAPLARTLDQELTALVRGVSLECLVCGEFVMHVRGAVVCPECRSLLAVEAATGEIETILAEVDARAG
jgi:Zn finger protein HypA/HybF involved in hydrogenase expression